MTPAGSKRTGAAEQHSSSSPGDEDLDLACEETIPGSPVHPSSDPAIPAASASASAKSSSSVSYPS